MPMPSGRRAEQAELERQMRETQIKNLEARLRQPDAGERRLVGIPEKFECVEGIFVLGLRTGDVCFDF